MGTELPLFPVPASTMAGRVDALYLFLILVFVAVENLFDVTERDFFGRKRSKP